MFTTAILSILYATGLAHAIAIDKVERTVTTTTVATSASTTCSYSTQLATPQPPNTLCGVTGNIKHPAPIGNSVQYNGVALGTVQKLCEHRCSLQQGCVAFSIGDFKNSVCTLFSKSLSSMDFTKSSGAVYSYWSIGCYQEICVGPCGVPSGEKFLLEVIQSGDPSLVGSFVSLYDNTTDWAGTFVELTSSQDMAQQFNFTSQCDLETLQPGPPLYGVETSFSQEENFSMDSESNYDELKQIEGALKLACTVKKGLLSCNVASKNTPLIFSVCPGSQYEVVYGGKTTQAASGGGGPCYEVEFTVVPV